MTFFFRFHSILRYKYTGRFYRGISYRTLISSSFIPQDVHAVLEGLDEFEALFGVINYTAFSCTCLLYTSDAADE